MKAILLGVLLTASFAYGGATSQFCTTVADVAETTMELRQAGVPLSRVLEVMGDSPYFMAMAVQAYKEPLWHGEDRKAHAIGEYRNEWHLACLEGGV